MSHEETVVPETTELPSVDQTDTSAANQTTKTNSKRSKKRKGKRQQRPIESNIVEAIKAQFAACQRCCYFLGGYTSAHGEEELQTDDPNNLPVWLHLTWDQNTRNLVHKTYGVRLDVDFYHYDGCCIACSRRFIYRADEEGKPNFRIQI
jgi:hypothetical protein